MGALYCFRPVLSGDLPLISRGRVRVSVHRGQVLLVDDRPDLGVEVRSETLRDPAMRVPEVKFRFRQSHL